MSPTRVTVSQSTTRKTPGSDRPEVEVRRLPLLRVLLAALRGQVLVASASRPTL